MWPQCWLCAVCAVGHIGCCVGGEYPVGVSISSSSSGLDSVQLQTQQMLPGPPDVKHTLVGKECACEDVQCKKSNAQVVTAPRGFTQKSVHASMCSARNPLCRSSLPCGGCACEYGQCKASTVQVVTGRCELGRARAARKSAHASMCSARNPLCRSSLPPGMCMRVWAVQGIHCAGRPWPLRAGSSKSRSKKCPCEYVQCKKSTV